MPWISDLYSSNTGCLGLGYRISRPWISVLYALNIECPCFEETHILTHFVRQSKTSRKKTNPWTRQFTTGFWMPWPLRIQPNIKNNDTCSVKNKIEIGPNLVNRYYYLLSYVYILSLYIVITSRPSPWIIISNSKEWK